jgi:dolichyl-phosphate-mannose-protein mannosyltransferase
MWIRHFLARALCLIVIPLGFYMAMFGIHFLCLVNPGDGDGFMSSEVSHLKSWLITVSTKSQF